MNFVTVSGSARFNSSNIRLLKALPVLVPKHTFLHYKISELPLFQSDLDKAPFHPTVQDWRKTVATADGLVIATPEYLHNLPACLKNALEWLTTSGELHKKPVLPITFTPHPPRGEKAMQSLLWTLQALNARPVAQLPLYQNEVFFDKNGAISDSPTKEILKEAIELFEG